MPDQNAVVKAYDIRGRFPEELDEPLAETIGRAFARLVRRNEPGTAQVALGRDMRPSGVPLAAAFTRGLAAEGLGVIDLGLASTDLVYFASGHLDVPAVMLTASHNPAGYNGMKLCLSGACPVGHDTGLSQLSLIHI